MYKTPAALEMAVKRAAKNSPQDTNPPSRAFGDIGCCVVYSQTKIALSC